MKELRRYGRVYARFLETSIAEEMSFRLNFFMLIAVNLAFFAGLVGSILVLFDHVDRIGDWNRDEFLFFVAVEEVIDTLFLAFFATNFWEFSDDLRTGNLDFTLTRPLSSLFLVFCRRIRIGGLLPALGMLGVAVWLGSRLPEGWTPDRVALFILFLSAAMLLKVGLEVLVGTLMFITVEGEAVNLLRLNFQAIQRQPDFVYGIWFRSAFSFVFPLLLVTTVPAKVMISPVWPPLVITFFFLSIGYVWWMVRLAWRWGLNRYESASS